MKNLRVSPIYIGLWIVVCVAASASLIKHLYDISLVYRRVRVLEEKNEALQKENDEKKRKIDESRTPFVREQLIRNELGMQKPGERVVAVLQTPEPSASFFPSQLSPPPPEKTFWDRVVRSGDTMRTMFLGIRDQIWRFFSRR